MTTSPSGSAPQTRVPLRLRLDEGFGSGALDGAWWPQSRDFLVEVADLVDHFPDLTGRVGRLLFPRPDRDATPGASAVRRIATERGPVKVGSFASEDTHVMIVKVLSGRRVRLLVIPSATEPGLAEEILQRIADPDDTRSPAELLGIPGAGGSAMLAADIWDDAAEVIP